MLHAAKITRHGVLEEKIGSQWTRKHEYMYCLGYDRRDTSLSYFPYEILKSLILSHNTSDYSCDLNLE